MTVFSALLLAGVLSALALAVGVAAGMRLARRAGRLRQPAAEWTGITVAQMLQRIVAELEALPPVDLRGTIVSEADDIPSTAESWEADS